MARFQCAAPNRYLLAIAGLMVIMGISIALAIIFPYQDLNAQQQAAAASATALRGAAGSGGVEEVESIIGGLVMDDSVGGGAATAKVVVSAEKDAESLTINQSAIAKSTSFTEQVAEAEEEQAESDTLDSVTLKVNVEDNVVENEPTVAKQEETETATDVTTAGSEDAVVNDEPTITEDVNESVSGSNIGVDEHTVSEHKEEVPLNNEAEDTATVDEPTNLDEEGSDEDMKQFVQAELTEGIFDKEDTPLEDNTATAETIPELSAFERQHCHTLLQQEANIVHPLDIVGPVEYVAFLTKLKADDISGVISEVDIANQYADLADELKENFMNSSCNCPTTHEDCCGDVRGVYVGDGSNLDEICEQTLQALEGLLN